MSAYSRIADRSADLFEDAIEKAAGKAADAVAAAAVNVADFLEDAGDGASKKARQFGGELAERITPEPEPHPVMALLTTGAEAVREAAKATRHAAEETVDGAREAVSNAGDFVDGSTAKLAHAGGSLAAVLHHGHAAATTALEPEKKTHLGRKLLIAGALTAAALGTGAAIVKWRRHQAEAEAVALEEAEIELMELAEEAAAELADVADAEELAEDADSVDDAVAAADADTDEALQDAAEVGESLPEAAPDVDVEVSDAEPVEAEADVEIVPETANPATDDVSRLN